MREKLSYYWLRIQGELFPRAESDLGPLSKKKEQLIKVLELVRIEDQVHYRSHGRVGRPLSHRTDLARAFIAKAVYGFEKTEDLIERLRDDKALSRLCGWESTNKIPSSSTFSRAFAEFAKIGLAQRAHKALLELLYEDKVVGHISRDSTAIHAREKAATVKKSKTVSKKRGRPKKGETRPAKEPTRTEQQRTQSLAQMLAQLPTGCDVGSKRNSKGYKESWKGYKLHIDVADGDIPISALLSSASMHDSQAAIPLATKTAKVVTSFYDLMDAAYDDHNIKAHSKMLGHVPLIDENPRRNKKRKEEIKRESMATRNLNFTMPEKLRYNQRSSVERVNGRIKDEFAGRNIYYKGHDKVFAHLMFSLLVITADQCFKLLC